MSAQNYLTISNLTLLTKHLKLEILTGIMVLFKSCKRFANKPYTGTRAKCRVTVKWSCFSWCLSNFFKRFARNEKNRDWQKKI